jgi:hypothetical protein
MIGWLGRYCTEGDCSCSRCNSYPLRRSAVEVAPEEVRPKGEVNHHQPSATTQTVRSRRKGCAARAIQPASVSGRGRREGQ